MPHADRSVAGAKNRPSHDSPQSGLTVSSRNGPFDNAADGMRASMPKSLILPELATSEDPCGAMDNFRGTPSIDDSLIDLDDFLTWCESKLELTYHPAPSDTLRSDLRLDDMQLYELVMALHELIGEEAIVTRDVFDNLGSIRDIHLYYLMICAMPNG